MSELFFTHYNPDLEIIVTSDTSLCGVGGCILHKMTDATLKPMAHALRALLPAEKIIHKSKKKLLGLYLQSQSYTAISTVNTSLYKQTTSHYSPFLAPKISSYAYSQLTAEMGYNPVKLQLQNGVPTIEKIWPCGRIVKANSEVQRTTEDTEITSLQSEGELKTTLCNTVRELPVTFEQIKQEALCDEYINKIKTKIFEKDQRNTDVVSICDNVLLYREHIVLLSILQKHILKDFNAGHPGSTRMKSLMHSYVHWPKMDKDVESTVKSAKAPPIKFNLSPK